MGQEQVVESLSAHLDSIKTNYRVGITSCRGIGWAGLSKSDPVKALGMGIARQNAFYVAAGFYVFINSKVLDILLHIHDLIKLLSPEKLLVGISRIALHPFTANPYSYFGKSFGSRIHSAKGYGLLIIIWWVANRSLYTLYGGSNILLQSITLIYVGVGLLSMLTIQKTFNMVLSRLEGVCDELREDILKTRVERGILTLLGIGLAGAIGFLAILSAL